jgi:hypothetical protein
MIWEVFVYFVDMDRIVQRHCLNFLLIMSTTSVMYWLACSPRVWYTSVVYWLACSPRVWYTSVMYWLACSPRVSYTSVVYWLACSPRIWYSVGSRSRWVRPRLLFKIDIWCYSAKPAVIGSRPKTLALNRLCDLFSSWYSWKIAHFGVQQQQALIGLTQVGLGL